MTEPEQEPRGADLDHDLQLAIELVERNGPEALQHWLRRRGERAAALAEEVDALLRAGLLRCDPGVEGPERIDRYRVLRRLGAGAMSVVYLGADDDLERLVAIKVLTPALASDERLRERFRREARALAALRHPGIVPVLAASEVQGQLFTVLEYVSGTSLEEGLARLRELTGGDPHAASAAALQEAFRLPAAVRVPDALPRLAAHWTRQLAEALAEAHRAGTVHRDVKPSNVMIDDEGHARLLDFGLAHVTDDVRMTWSKDVIGTPRYLAPEVVLQGVGASDHRVDLFALGACLHELLTLAPPFAGVSAAQVLRQILEHDPDPPSRANRAVSRDLDAVTQVALSKDPARRYLDARAMADDLGRLLAGVPVRARAPGPLARALRAARRRPLVAGLGAVLALVLLATVAIVLAYNVRLRARTEQAVLARQSTEFALGFLQELLELSDVEELGPDVPAQTLLSEGAARVMDARRWPDAGLVRPRLARTLGALSWGAGDLNGATELLELARDLLQGPPPDGVDPGDWRLELARSENYRGNVLRARGLRAEAEGAYRAALVAASATPGAPGREQEATVLANLADLLGELGELDEAEGYARRALELSVGDDEEASANRAWGLIALARLQVRGGRLAAAVASIEEARDVAATMDDRPLQEAMVLDAGAMLAAAMNDHGRAAGLLEEEAALYERTVGPDAAILGETLVGVGTMRRAAGDARRARAAFERGLAILDAAAGPDHPKRVRALMGLGLLTYEADDAAAARAHLSEVVRAWSSAGSGLDELTELDARLVLAAAQAELGDPDAARATVIAASARLAPELAERPAFVAARQLAEARIARAAGDLERAAQAYAEAIARSRAAGGELPIQQVAEAELAEVRALRAQRRGPDPDPGNPENR